jgi:transposase
LMLHKTRELLVKQRTMAVNALRGHLSEFGLIAPKGIHRDKELLALAQADETLPEEEPRTPRHPPRALSSP